MPQSCGQTYAMKNKEKTSDFSRNRALPISLREAKVVIWGLGLMGGSLAMALHGKTRWLAGLDSEKTICQQSLALQIVDAASTNPAEILPEADVIILAVPLDLIPTLLGQLPELIPSPAVVLDLGSTKVGVLEAMQNLPDRFAVIGGHPMCGKESNTLSNASAEIYSHASFALLKLDRTPLTACILAEELVRVIGSIPVWLEAQPHDQWVAATSHLPYLAANALAAVIPVESALLVGPGYLSTTRLASESERMMMDILANNRENILPLLARYRQQIEKIEAALVKDDREALQKLFHEGRMQHEAVFEQFRKVIQS